jgi:hypothetical protein
VILDHPTQLALHRLLSTRWPEMTQQQRRRAIEAFRGWLLWREAQDETGDAA